MEPRLDGADGDLEGVGDLGQRLALEVVQHEQGAVVGREPIERPLDGVDGGGAFVGRRARRGQGLDRVEEVAGGDLADPPTPPPAQGLAAAVDDDPSQPGVEASGVTEPASVAPGIEDGVLGRVAGVGLVAEDRPGGPVDAVDPMFHQGPERRPVAGLGPLHEGDGDLGIGP